jgi:hypothetical protein
LFEAWAVIPRKNVVEGVPESVAGEHVWTREKRREISRLVESVS